MPWHVERSDECPESRPYAVIKDDDGSVEGCHASEAAAEEQMAALYASEADERAVSLKPTSGMASAAKRGLRLHEEGKSGSGLKPETVRRANKLANREEMNRDWVVEMNAWFARHASDKKPGWDKPGSESAGYTAHLLWGGNAAKSWSARKVKELERAGERNNQWSDRMNIERRDIEFATDGLSVETRDDGQKVIRALGIVFNKLSVDLGGFRERILPSAFTDALSRKEGRQDLVSYFNHNQDIVLGRESSGTMRVWTDDRGVWFEVTPPRTRADIVELVERGDVRGASMMFSLSGPNAESFVEDDQGNTIREVRSAKLYEIGVVVHPAYPDTTADVATRSFKAWQASQEDSAPPAEEKRQQRQSPSARLKAAILRSL